MQARWNTYEDDLEQVARVGLLSWMLSNSQLELRKVRGILAFCLLLGCC